MILWVLVFVAGTWGFDPTDVSLHFVNKTVKPLSINAGETIKIFTNKSQDDFFALFSCHCRTAMVTMHLPGISSVKSTNPALVHFIKFSASFPYRDRSPNITGLPSVFITNPNTFNVTVLAQARSYTETDPVPGGCLVKPNFASWWPKSTLSIHWDTSVIKLNFTKATLPQEPWRCNERDKFEYEIYHMYLQEGTDPEELDKDFVESLGVFTDIEDIRKYGTQVEGLGWPKSRTKVVFASYPPTGSLYAVVVRYHNGNITGRALYGVSHTYSCDMDPHTGLCTDYTHIVTNIICGLAVFVGLLMAFAGHRFFITSQFIFGFYAGSFVGFILLNIGSSWSYYVNFSLTAVCGLVGAALATVLWLLLAVPVISVFLPTLEIGVLVASILMFTPSMNVASLVDDLYYWLVFLCIVLAIPGILLAFTQKASIMACVFIGTYTTILPIDFFLGTNLRYISINVLRRATEKGFSEALILPPLQVADLALLACWLGLALAALVTQLLIERKKAPFPPSPFHLFRWRREVDLDGSDGETAPLVDGEVTMAGQEPVASPVVGYILGYSSVATGLPVQGGPAAGQRSTTSDPRTTQERQPRVRTSGNPGRSRDIFKPPTPDGDLPPYSPSLP